MQAEPTEKLEFPSEKSPLFAWVLFGGAAVTLACSTPLFWIYLNIAADPILLIAILFCLLCVAFLIWLWFDTGYVISGDKLHYRSGPIRGSVSIASINHITKNETSYAGLKPALATKGLIIRYNKWDDIYISPVNKDRFVEILLERNPEITVKEWNESKINFNKY